MSVPLGVGVVPGIAVGVVPGTKVGVGVAVGRAVGVPKTTGGGIVTPFPPPPQPPATKKPRGSARAEIWKRKGETFFIVGITSKPNAKSNDCGNKTGGWNAKTVA